MRKPLLLALLLLPLTLVAQQPAPADGGSSEVLQSIFIPPLANAPFTLTLATEWVKPLGDDGNTITVVNERRIARDHAGRVYQERVLLMPQNMAANMKGKWIVNLRQIADPALHTNLNCFTATKVCRTTAYNVPVTAPELDSGTTKFSDAIQQRQSLGRDVIDGLEVQGVHETTVIAAGVFGNAKPVTIDREFWYSADLGINLRSVRNDPRVGKQTFTVIKVSRDEPDAALWQIPDGYAVVDEAPAAKQ